MLKELQQPGNRAGHKGRKRSITQKVARRTLGLQKKPTVHRHTPILCKTRVFVSVDKHSQNPAYITVHTFHRVCMGCTKNIVFIRTVKLYEFSLQYSFQGAKMFYIKFQY